MQSQSPQAQASATFAEHSALVTKPIQAATQYQRWHAEGHNAEYESEKRLLERLETQLKESAMKNIDYQINRTSSLWKYQTDTRTRLDPLPEIERQNKTDAKVTIEQVCNKRKKHEDIIRAILLNERSPKFVKSQKP